MTNIDKKVEIAHIIANNLRDIREKQGFSLNELARKANIGKATLSVLEAGKGNPNIETIWAIANALEVPFGQLIDSSSSEVKVVRKGEGTSVNTKQKSIEAELLISRSRRGTFELFLLKLSKEGCRKAKPHVKGTVEHIFVKKGTLEVGPVEKPLILNTGDLISFSADIPHIYKAHGLGVEALVIVDYI